MATPEDAGNPRIPEPVVGITPQLGLWEPLPTPKFPKQADGAQVRDAADPVHQHGLEVSEFCVHYARDVVPIREARLYRDAQAMACSAATGDVVWLGEPRAVEMPTQPGPAATCEAKVDSLQLVGQMPWWRRPSVATWALPLPPPEL